MSGSSPERCVHTHGFKTWLGWRWVSRVQEQMNQIAAADVAVCPRQRQVAMRPRGRSQRPARKLHRIALTRWMNAEYAPKNGQRSAAEGANNRAGLSDGRCSQQCCAHHQYGRRLATRRPVDKPGPSHQRQMARTSLEEVNPTAGSTHKSLDQTRLHPRRPRRSPNTRLIARDRRTGLTRDVLASVFS